MEPSKAAFSKLGTKYETHRGHFNVLRDGLEAFLTSSHQIPSLSFVKKEDAELHFRFLGATYVIRLGFRPFEDGKVDYSAISLFWLDEINLGKFVPRTNLVMDIQGNVAAQKSFQSMSVVKEAEQIFYELLAGNPAA